MIDLNSRERVDIEVGLEYLIREDERALDAYNRERPRRVAVILQCVEERRRLIALYDKIACMGADEDEKDACRYNAALHRWWRRKNANRSA